MTELLLAVDFHLDRAQQVVVVTSAERAAAEPLLAVVRRSFGPNRVLIVGPEHEVADLAKLVPGVSGKVLRGGLATA